MGLSPMMLQYLQVKEKCKDCILFYRVGDFYEMFFDDAKTAARDLELVLTGKDCGMEERAPMCGIPYHAANSYIARLIGKGYKVAIGEQMEDPSTAKGIVKRDIIKIVTPGTYMDPSFLEDKKNNYLMSIYIEKEMAGLCFADISTGEFLCTLCENNISTINDEISKFLPKEILLLEGANIHFKKSIDVKFQISFTERSKEYFVKDSDKNLKLQFSNYDDSMAGPIKYAASGLLSYIIETQKLALSNINKIEVYNTVDYLTIDSNSRRNLELTETLRDKSKKGSLLWVLDNTTTSMGGRRLRKWIEQPLVNKEKIEQRLDAVEELVLNVSLQDDIKEALQGIYDIERIAGKISSQSVNARELISLKNSIERIPYIKELLRPCESTLIVNLREKIDTMEDIYQLIDRSIKDNPSTSIKDGDIIKDDYNEDISELRKAKSHGKEWIAALESSEKEVTGIKSLKVGYNKVFGYYIEVTNANLSLIPEGRYIRKQTLTNGERFITPELKEMENKILGAEEKLSLLEYEIFVEIRTTIEKQIERMKETSKVISEIDTLNSFAQVAIANNYCKPEINSDGKIKIKDGRHPVIEKVISTGSFVSNDTYIDNKNEQLLLITGPNMAGKSTYMRQIALISVMAQMGSFVPAASASLSICDKIFTRIGASDDLTSGKSTFMVEMWEVSNILKNATPNSLVLLDEVGRGTSTYDGLSIAWAVIEYICKNRNMKCKTLFATHYHELIKLEGKIKGVKNYSIDVKKIDGEIVFLRKIVPHGTDESFGIEVAKLAGIPDIVIDRAREILESLENNHKEIKVKDTSKMSQINFLDFEKDKLIDELSSIDVLNMTPIESLNKLYDIVNKARNVK